MRELKASELQLNLLFIYIYIELFLSWILNLCNISLGLGMQVLSFFDVIPLIIFIFHHKLIKPKRYLFVNNFNFWFAWLFLLFLLLINAFRFNVNFLSAIINWGALVRFIPLAYFMIRFKSINVFNRFTKHIYVISAIFLAVGYLCIINNFFSYLFLPLTPEKSTALIEIENGYITPFFSNTIEYSFLLVILYSFVIIVNKFNFVTYVFVFFIFLIPIFKSGSMMSVVVFSIINIYILSGKYKIINYFMYSIGPLLIILMSYKYRDILFEIIDNAKLSRLGLILNTFPDFVSNLDLDTFIGVGVDGRIVLDKVNSFDEKVHLLLWADDGDISAFSDVFWVAISVFYGLVGLFVMIYIFWGLYKTLMNNCFVLRRLIVILFMCIILFSFTNQILSVRTFALFFWLYLGIIYNLNKNIYENTTNKQL